MKVLNQIVQKSTGALKSAKPLKYINEEIAQTTKRVFPFAAAAASVVLANYALDAKNKEETEEPSIDSNFLEVLSQDLAAHKYMHKEDVYYLALNFESAPALVADLIMQKDEKGNLRMLRRESIEPIFEAYQINPEYTEELINEKNENGEFKYSSDEIKILADLSVTMPEALAVATSNPTRVLDLLKRENEAGRKLYSLKDIQTLFYLETIEPQETKYYMNMKDYDSKEPRFTANQIKLILKKKKEFPELVNTLIEEKDSDNKGFRFDAQSLTEILQLMDKDNIQVVKNLEKQKDIYSINSKEYIAYKYRPEEIISLIKKKKESEFDLLVYCAENYYYVPKLKKLLNEMDITTISEDTYKKLKEYRTDGYNGWRQVKKPFDYTIMNVFKTLLEPKSADN